MPMTYLPTVSTFVSRYRIKHEMREVDDNPKFLADDVPVGARHYEITLRNGQASMVFVFTTDEGPPDLVTILTALAAESNLYETYRHTKGLNDRQQIVLEALKENAINLEALLGNTYGDLLGLVSR